jgi:branched-chain amino acid transport system ATP-binding protein
MLEIGHLRASHGAVEALRGVSLTVASGQVVAVVGTNGAGKTTLARAVAGLHREKTGAIRLHGRDLAARGPVDVARAGVAIVPQGRRLFGSLTVEEHLTLSRRHARRRAMTTGEALELFPRLAERSRVRARSLSGGEQQMLAIARAVLLGPDVLVLDEPTEGLAPSVVELVAGLIARLRRDQVGILLMEQEARFPFDVADAVLTLARGRILPGAASPEPDKRVCEEVGG